MLETALISVYDKTGLEPVVRALHQAGVQLLSTGGTRAAIEAMGLPVRAVEDLTGYPSILGGRVKTLHPNVFGGILAQRDVMDDANDLAKFSIPLIDVVIVDLYPFRETLAAGGTHAEVIEKIDIGGVSLIRAAAKNAAHVLLVPGRDHYPALLAMLQRQGGRTTAQERLQMAAAGFQLTAAYDGAVAAFLAEAAHTPRTPLEALTANAPHRHLANPLGNALLSDISAQPGPALPGMPLRYGENPHQHATFYGDLAACLHVQGGKALSYNNLLDIDAALALVGELAANAQALTGKPRQVAFAIVKHNNACGVALRSSPLEAYQAALAADPTSAFGGVLVCSAEIDEATAHLIDGLFYEVLVAPAFSAAARAVLQARKQRILARLVAWPQQAVHVRSALGGLLAQDADTTVELPDALQPATTLQPTPQQRLDLAFAALICKHTKSNAIVFAANGALISSGTGQTSRIDALEQAVAKAARFGQTVAGSAMASDAFFPFPDCVEAAAAAGVAAIVQPGGSLKDALSIEAANRHNLVLCMSGVRHFKH